MFNPANIRQNVCHTTVEQNLHYVLSLLNLYSTNILNNNLYEGKLLLFIKLHRFKKATFLVTLIIYFPVTEL